MTYYQNVFASDFIGNLLLADRQHVPSFKCRLNAGRGDDYVVAWKKGPYNLSGNDSDSNTSANLNVYFAIDPEFKGWTLLSIDITADASSSSAVTVDEIVSALNDHTLFAERFEALKDGNQRLMIRKRNADRQIKFYIANGNAEEKLGFNDRAGIDQLPSYFERHTLENRFTYADSVGLLISLDPSGSNVDKALINNAKDYRGNLLGYDGNTVDADWKLLKGKSGIFTFKKITVDGSNRITQIIEYPAGAVAGDFAKKTKYTYTSSNTNPDKSTEEPYTLTNSDLVTP